MSGKKSKPDKRQENSDIEDLTDRFSQATKIQLGKTDVPSVPGPSASPTGAGDSGKKIKIASWNIKQLNDSDESRLNAISRVISTKGFDIVAIQEIFSPNALEKIKAKLPDYENWCCEVSPAAGKGFSQRDEYFGFLYKRKSGIELTASALINVKINPDKYEVLGDVKKADKTEVHLTESILQSGTENFKRKPYIGLFKINEFEFNLINVHNSYAEDQRKNEAKTLLKLTPLVDFGKNVIILGDFNLAHKDEAIKGLSYEYESCIDGPTNYNLDIEYDNIWIGKAMLDQCSKGESGVIRGKLTYLDENRQKQNLSDHRPIFVTLSIK